MYVHLGKSFDSSITFRQCTWCNKSPTIQLVNINLVLLQKGFHKPNKWIMLKSLILLLNFPLFVLFYWLFFRMDGRFDKLTSSTFFYMGILRKLYIWINLLGLLIKYYRVCLLIKVLLWTKQAPQARFAKLSMA